jgi:hypothetical protein
MNPIKKLAEVTSLIITVLLLVFFARACIGFGWHAHRNPLLRPIVGAALGLNQDGDKPGFLDRLLNRPSTSPDESSLTSSSLEHRSRSEKCPQISGS